MNEPKPMILDFEVFPMMQHDAGYWWAVYDEHGHIRKLGRKDTQDEAEMAAIAWIRAVSEMEKTA